jgi:hypothetical protein
VITYIDKLSKINLGFLSSSIVAIIREKMPKGDKLCKYKFFNSLLYNCLLIYSLTYQMIHVISLMLILHRSETSSTICLASLPIDNKAAPNVEHKKIKPNKFRPRRLPADVFSRLSLVSFLRTLSRRVSYSLNEISTILSGKRFLLKID